jgi:MoxR-like ATPase
MESRRPDASPAAFAEAFGAITDNIGLVLQGQPEVIEMTLVCLVAEGHLLVEDVPGVGKTSLAKALATSIDCRWSRLQFTPDLLPSDVVGVTVWNRGTNEFEFRAGAVFANIVLGDEINRASPKTQSALLEAMEERQVTVDGVTYPLDPPFMVVATQNPIEHEGTYPLPESQLDRFLVRLTVGYPSPRSELEILETHGASSPVDELSPVATVKDVVAMSAAAREVHVATELRGYLVELAAASRRHPSLAIGMSPRATLALQRTARARAIARGRDYVIPDDIKALAGPVLGHRLVRTPEATMQGVSADEIVDDILSHVAVPTARAPEG